MRHVLIIWVWACAACLWGRPSHRSLTLDVKDGMSSQMTYDLAKDQEGFLWISHRMGIDRYDGHAFKSYPLFERPEGILLQNDGKHHHLTTDREGHLICYTDRGNVLRHDAATDHFVPLYCATSILDNHSLHAAAVWGDTLLLGLHNGLHWVDLRQEGSDRLLCPQYNIRTIVSDGEGKFLIGSTHGLARLDVRNGLYTPLGLETLDVKSLYHDVQSHRIWVGTNGSGLWIIPSEGGEARQIAHWENVIVTQIQPYGEEQLLVGTDGSGLLATSRRTLAPLQPYASDGPGAPYLLPGAGIQGLLVDDDKVWVSIFDCGISLLHPVSAVYCLAKSEASPGTEQRVNDVGVDAQGHIWVAYRQLVSEFDPESGQSRAFPLDNPNLLTLRTASDGTVWCGGYNAGIFHLDPSTGLVSHLASLDDRPVSSNVYAIFEDRQQNVWVGSQFSPLVCIRPERNRPSHYIPPVGRMLSYPITRVNDIGQLNADTMVVATTNGVVLLDRRSGRQWSLMDENDTLWPGTNYISCLDTDGVGHVYIGTDGSGLVCYDAATGVRIHYSKQNGFPSNFIRSIECVGDTTLWISTEKEGLFSFHLGREEVTHRLTRNQGLSFLDFFQDVSAQSPDGTLVFGGRGGAEVIHPNALSVPTERVLLKLSEVGIGQEERISSLSHPQILGAPLSDVREICFPYGENDLRLTFSAVSLYQNSDLRLEYCIGEEEEYWQPMGEQRMIALYSLPPGRHSLRVRCLRGQQIVAETVLVIAAEQSPWLRWPAILCYVVAALMLLSVVLLTIGKHLRQVSMEEKIRFFSSVAHDIRTPISLVTSPLAELESYLRPEAPSHLMPLIKRNLRHLNDVVNQLSLFNREQRSGEMNLEPVCLNRFVEGLQEAYQCLASQKGLALDIELPEDALWVYADVKALQRIFDNLLGNAFKFTSSGGIRLVVRRKGQRGLVDVTDTGIGMSEKIRRRLFRHFFRGENAIKGNIPGFGLGMMYTYQSVCRMGGSLSCQSQEGRGSTFSLLLPSAPAGDAADYDFSGTLTDVADQPYHPVYSGYRYNVLVVEDNPDLLDYLCQKLGEGYNVHRATEVEEARRLLPTLHPDLIISDIVMPGMHGDEWCRQLKQDFETSHIPVILLTANADYESQMHGLDMGADDYVTKPFDINLLLRRIRNLFDARRRMHAYYMQVLQGDRQGQTADTKPETSSTENVETASRQATLEEQFVSRLSLLIEQQIDNPALNIDALASEMAMSHTLFYEKVNKLLGMPPASLIRQYRMQRARQLLQSGGCTISEVAQKCGFADAKYFSTAYKKCFGISPSQTE